MGLVLAVNQVLDVGNQHRNLFEVKHIHSPILCERGVENVHADSGVFDHRKSVQSMTDIVLPQDVVHNNLDVCASSLHYPIEGGMTLHAFVDDLDVLFAVVRLGWIERAALDGCLFFKVTHI
jgi:hypothetical protein